MAKSSEKRLLSEDQAVELIALFLSSARLLISEPPAYGPLRLLTATERLSAMILDDASPTTKKLLQVCIDRIPHTYTLANEVKEYAAAMDELCDALGQCLVDRAKLQGGS
ncbi:MAG: DUF6092 family protein [Anaerolineaceae bacterium]|nr:DUF6092 family protein [Anaerolineaceae bacterium]